MRTVDSAHTGLEIAVGEVPLGAANEQPGRRWLDSARVIDDPGYRAAAGRMADRLAAERDDSLVVDELEHMAVGARGGR